MSDQAPAGGDGGGGGGDGDRAGASTDEILYIHHGDPYWNTHDNKTGHVNKSLAGGSNATGDLASANRDLAMHLVALLAILVVLLLLTILGNAMVCLVYRSRFRRTTANLCVVFLAALQIVTTCLGVPMEMAVLALPLMFYSQVACKMMRYVETVSVCVVLLTLTAIAADRYCKLTRPANFVPQRWAKGLCILAVLLALVLSVPAIVLFGSKSVPTSIVNVTGVACGVADDVSSNLFRIIYIVPLLLTFVFSLATMAVLYILMFIRICQKKSATRGERVSPARREYPRKHRFVTEDSTSSCGGEETRKFHTSASSSGPICTSSSRSGRTSPGMDPARVPLKSGVKESARIGQGASSMVDVQSTRMTFIFFIISVLCVVCVTPFILLRTLQALTDLVDTLQPLALRIVYEVCVRLYLLHPPLVPLIYLLCNHNFRREAKHLLQKVGLSCQRPAPIVQSNTSGRERKNNDYHS
ncbi:probable G-protein coupled receptor No18 [Littorina saxatilis]|uniref:G-protein coupled receptors family 1 profile domain-containing protein n=1 Tax=Littorina saxatilis TaxID=31220 RepID=A0AAN9BH05_9CAEN